MSLIPHRAFQSTSPGRIPSPRDVRTVSLFHMEILSNNLPAVPQRLSGGDGIRSPR